MAEKPPLPFVLTVRVPVGFYDQPAPAGQSVIRSVHVPDWLPITGMDVELAKKDTRSIAGLMRRALDTIPPLFPLP